MSKKKTKKSISPSVKESKLANNLQKVTHQFVMGKGYAPLSFSELMNRLSLPQQHEPILQEILDNLIKNGALELTNEKYMPTKASAEIITGVLRVHPRGFGFLQASQPNEYGQDIFIPKHLTMNAVDGDTVEVLVNSETFTEKGPEGRVVTILERSRTHMAGIIRRALPIGDYMAYVPLLGPTRKVIVKTSDENTLKEGDRIIMEVLDWGDKDSDTVCRFSHLLGHISDPSCDIKAAIEEYELRSEFPSKVIKEALEYGTRVSPSEWGDREDFREIECFTIDPDTAKDYDDAVHVIKTKSGGYQLGVHIADVSHYVKLGTALDTEARQRCNSTYFPGVCIPMLPPVLSDNLCSLKANVNRLTVSVIVDFDENGNMLNYRIARSVIKSRKRFTYKEAMQVLEGKKKSPHLPSLQLMVELCKLLKQKRYERGSIEFALPDLVVITDEHGVPQKTDYIQYDITHQLIEEFALKANEIVATYLTKIGKNLAYRVHDEPAEENLKDFAILARAFGFELKNKPTPNELQQLFDEALETHYGPYLATNFIRRMRLATYSSDNIGHYGLALTHYCHFTSPIRRYIDLVVHRLLFGEDDNLEALQEVAKKCSEQERISARAETSVVVLKKLRLLDRLVKEDSYREFPAVITRIKNFGFYFEVIELMLEGFLHVSELENDYFVYEEAAMRLKGRRTGKIHTPGNTITVTLKDIDFILSEATWHLVPEKAKRAPQKSKTAKSEVIQDIPVPSKSEIKQKKSSHKEQKKATPTKNPDAKKITKNKIPEKKRTKVDVKSKKRGKKTSPTK